MTFKSARFASNARLRSAKQNNPPLRHGERGEAVAILQEALIDLAYPMPLSTSYGSHRADGIYGDETLRSVQAFQGDYGLQRDGIAGKETLDRLDEIFSSTNEISYVAALWMIVQAGERLLRAPGTKQLIGLSYYATLMMQLNQLKTELARYGLVSNPARSTTFASAQTFRSNSLNEEATAIPAPWLLLLALIAALTAGAAITTLPKPKLPSLPRRPPPVIPEMVSHMAGMAAGVALMVVTKTTAQFQACKEQNPHRLEACADLLNKLDEITGKLRKKLVTAKSPHKFPNLQEEIDSLQKEYNDAVDAAIKCLGCTNFKANKKPSESK